MISPSATDASDVDCLFLQPGVEEATVSGRQNCGNLLAGVGPFTMERGLVAPGEGITSVHIHMVNSNSMRDVTDGIDVTCIDNGMPVVVAANSTRPTR